MGISPISASPEGAAKAGLTIDDIDLFEINEAFAAQCLACQKTLGIPDEKLNVNGGGISPGASCRSYRLPPGHHLHVRADEAGRQVWPLVRRRHGNRRDH